jgi:hypothetical protein
MLETRMFTTTISRLLFEGFVNLRKRKKNEVVERQTDKHGEGDRDT